MYIAGHEACEWGWRMALRIRGPLGLQPAASAGPRPVTSCQSAFAGSVARSELDTGLTFAWHRYHFGIRFAFSIHIFHVVTLNNIHFHFLSHCKRSTVTCFALTAVLCSLLYKQIF